MTDTAITAEPTYLSKRAIVRLSPADNDENVRDFLQGLLTQDMHAVTNGAALWSGLLSPQGKLLFEFLLWDDGDDILIDCEDSSAAALTRRLSLYRLRRKITIRIDEGITVHWALEKSAPTTALHAQPDPRLADLGYRWLANEEQPNDTADHLWRTHRLQCGVPEGQSEFGEEKILWLECNAEELNGVSYTKGCFIGQENTARMHYRSKINRRIAVVPTGLADAKRVRHSYADMGLDIIHAPISDMIDWPLPEWQRQAILGSQ